MDELFYQAEIAALKVENTQLRATVFVAIVVGVFVAIARGVPSGSGQHGQPLGGIR